MYSSSLQIRVNGSTRAPSAPTNLRAAAGDRQIALSWDDPGNNTIGKYQVSKNAGAEFPAFDDIIGSSATTTEHTLTSDLSNGTRYTLGVRASNRGGQGRVSMVTATPLWPAPENLTATPRNKEVELEWDTGDSGIAGYKVTAVDAIGSATPVTSFVPRGSGPKTNTTITGLANGTDYAFTVQAAKIYQSTTVITGKPSTKTVTMPPAAPANLWPMPRDARVTLSWTDPGNDSITGYQVSTDGGTNYTDIIGSSATTTTHDVGDLTNGFEYTIKLRR